MSKWGRWIVAALALGPASAHAQVDITLELDRVMVMPIQAESDALQGEAARLDALLRDQFEDAYILVELTEVPRFEQLDYDAKAYLDACPPGQYAGCALVIAQRAPEVDWVIGATLAPVDGLGPGQAQLTFHLIDIPGSTEVMAFGVVVGGQTNDAAVLQGVGGVFDNVVSGLVDEVDVRGQLDDPAAQAAFEERRQKLIAASLEKLEGQLGEVIREELVVGRLEAPKLTKRDLEQYTDRDDRPPWVRLDMSQAQYVRFENSGATLVDWRRRARGRLGQILLRADFGGGPGTWGVHHEGRWLVEFNQTTSQFENVAIRQYEEGRRGGSFGFQGELGFGVLPWVEVAGVYGLRNVTYSYRFKQDSAADPVAIPGDLIQTGARTTELGFRILVAPLPTYQIRPTAHIGYFVWSGGSVEPEQDPLIPLEGTRASYFQVGPGAELSAGRYLNLFVRGHLNALTSGFWFSQRQDGQVDRLQSFEEPIQDYRGGWDVQAGFQVRIGLLPEPTGSVQAGGRMEDDEVLEEPDL